MSEMTTYSLAKLVIDRADYATQEQKDKLQIKLDVFLLADRLTQEEYTELTGLLETKALTGPQGTEEQQHLNRVLFLFAKERKLKEK